jgi:hypothetical protein
MTKKKMFLGIVCMLLALVFMTVSCVTSVDVKSNLAGEYNMIPKIAGKDFTVLGIISLNTKVEHRVAPFRLTTRTEGERITFDALMKEAVNQYPNVSDIINIRIDVVNKSSTSIFDFFTGTTSITEYYANAVAIQYTASLPEGEKPIPGTSGTIQSAVADDAAPVGGGGIISKILGLFGVK